MTHKGPDAHRITRPAKMPAAEIDVTPTDVKRLVAAQFPDLAALPLTFLAHGWDNLLFRLGEDYVVRLPRRELAAALVANEQRWLPQLSERLPIPIAVPLRFGRPAEGYPWPWTIARYVAGEDLARSNRGKTVEASFTDPSHEMERFAEFLTALHVEAPPDAPDNPYRGVPLRERDRITGAAIDGLDSTFDVDAIRKVWTRAVSVDPWPRAGVWLHGDLHPGNVVVADGRVAAVIDFGDLTAGDPATDLAAAWMLFGEPRRSRLRELLDYDDETWVRAHGWALAFALMLVRGSADNPIYFEMGDRLLADVLGSIG